MNVKLNARLIYGKRQIIINEILIIFFFQITVLSAVLQPPENVSAAPFADSDEPRFDAKNHNYTDCCLTKNVTNSCLGFCNIQNILEGNTGQDPENCENDFPEIVKCMAGESKHFESPFDFDVTF